LHGQIKLNAVTHACHHANHTFMLSTYKWRVLHAADQWAAFGDQSP